MTFSAVCWDGGAAPRVGGSITTSPSLPAKRVFATSTSRRWCSARTTIPPSFASASAPTKSRRFPWSSFSAAADVSTSSAAPKRWIASASASSGCWIAPRSRTQPGVLCDCPRSMAELEKMRRAGVAVHQALRQAAVRVRPGATTWELEEAADAAIREQGATSAFRGYRGFPCVLCVSVNEQVIHGIPSRKRILKAGEIVSLDCGVVLDGYFADHAVTVMVGKPEETPAPVRKLLEVTQQALADAIDQ